MGGYVMDSQTIQGIVKAAKEQGIGALAPDVLQAAQDACIKMGWTKTDADGKVKPASTKLGWLLCAGFGRHLYWSNEEVAKLTNTKPGSVSSSIGVNNKGDQNLLNQLRSSNIDTEPFTRPHVRKGGGGGEAVDVDDLMAVFADD